MDDDKVFSDLELIKNVMASCSRKQEDNGVYFKLWGILIPAATLLNYLLVYIGKSFMIWILWAVIMISGILLSTRISMKRKTVNTSSTGSKLISAIWGSSWISIALIVTVGMVSGILNLNAEMFMISTVMAVAFFVSGVLAGNSMLKIAAAGWWIFGAAIVFVPSVWAPALLGGGTFFLSFIPGLLLDRAYRIKNLQTQN